jgi:hypothetical protein
VFKNYQVGSLSFQKKHLFFFSREDPPGDSADAFYVPQPVLTIRVMLSLRVCILVLAPPAILVYDSERGMPSPAHRI